MNTQHSDIIKAAQSSGILEAALGYHQLGFSVLPLKDKRPACTDWKQYQQTTASADQIQAWHKEGLLQNIGVVCGAVSNNLVVLDLDGVAGYPAFAATFPDLAETYTVTTGGGIGTHVYWRVERLPEAIKAMGTPLGNIEICAEGRQIVMPPSKHPKTGKSYQIAKEVPLLHVADLDVLVRWVESFKPRLQTPYSPPPAIGNSDLNPKVVEAIARYFTNQGYKVKGEWLHGRCIYPNRHANGDAHPSFGYNVVSGVGHCYKCGTILSREVCSVIGINPSDYGGLTEKPRHVLLGKEAVRLADPRPQDSAPPDTPDVLDSSGDLKLPKWLQMYLDWAGTTGNETPMSFHLGAGLWLLSVAIGRRLYAEAPWGVKIYPNLYLMMIASTTYYRKSTAYKLAERIAREAIPHMLVPTPGSPERFQEALSGRLPANFDKLTSEQQIRLKQALPFAAQRGLLKDEVAGLFGSINKRDYMVGMKDLLMELYDCPDYSDKDTQTGLTIIENAALSILGVTTPSGLSAAISDADWSNGLLIRFGLLTPEPNYRERPAPKVYQPPPSALIEGLKNLYNKLPMPEQTEDALKLPSAIQFQVDCWEECRAYGEDLRQLCNPNREMELDERLKGVYGRMHVLALKVAELLAAVEWLEGEHLEMPVITKDCWETAKIIAESWRNSAARLLTQIDKSSEAMQERREQDRLLHAIQRAGIGGVGLRDLYRNLNLSAKRARLLAQDLVKAGLIIERQHDRAEWYIASESMS